MLLLFDGKHDWNELNILLSSRYLDNSWCKSLGIWTGIARFGTYRITFTGIWRYSWFTDKTDYSKLPDNGNEFLSRDVLV